MRLEQLSLKDFGPFRRYKVSFIDEDQVCILLTGKNNEGKSSLINALKLLNAATKVINKTKQEFKINGNYYYRLLQQDTENLLIGRMIHNYTDNVAEISGKFRDGLTINVYLDPTEEMIYSNFEGNIPRDIQNIFGFIPPLGPISEEEDVISKLQYLKASIETSLAPRHLRNHLYQILSSDEFNLVREIIKKSWPGIELMNYEHNYRRNKIYCYYKEDRVEREISWAGQGLQVWFQIVTHLVRLRKSSILILDEPEINLHPEKQNDLIRILRDYYFGSIIIATHSMELMNNVSVSHIINVQKKHSEPKFKSTDDRTYLNLVRSQVGSNFNLIASQFEEFDLIVFTEDTFDFKILQHLASGYKISKKAFNIPIHGFSEFKKCIAYKHAYHLLIGKDIQYTAVLDRDYYPEEYLFRVKQSLVGDGIRVIYTLGKEIENTFLFPDILSLLIDSELTEKFLAIWNQMFVDFRMGSFGSFLTLHKQFLNSGIDMKTVTTLHGPTFEHCWNDPDKRHLIVEGKEALSTLRSFYREQKKTNLNQSVLIDAAIKSKNNEIRCFVEEIFQVKDISDQSLHY
jgi:energy-coupling factor transporter ATP-binding protein EcfA2